MNRLWCGPSCLLFSTTRMFLHALPHTTHKKKKTRHYVKYLRLVNVHCAYASLMVRFKGGRLSVLKQKIAQHCMNYSIQIHTNHSV